MRDKAYSILFHNFVMTSNNSLVFLRKQDRTRCSVTAISNLNPP